MVKGGPHIDCRPRDAMTDPLAADFAKRALNFAILEDNTRRYTQVRGRVVRGALGVGTWYAMAHWDTARGGVLFESLAPSGKTEVFVCPGYVDLHDPMCPDVLIVRHETIASIKAKKGWDNTAELWPDNDGRYGSEMEYTRARGEPSGDDQYADDTVTTVYEYCRSGDEKYTESGGSRELSSDQQYMACPNCPYRDMQHERMPDGNLPEQGTACPECLMKAMMGEISTPSYLYRVSRENLTDTLLKYPKGRLRIVAPHQDKLFYEGEWQAPCRSFPMLQLRAYEHPDEQAGGCDTLIYWSLQTLMNQMRRQMYEQMVTAKPLFIIGGDPVSGRGLVDSKGRPLRITDENHGQVGYAPDAPAGVPLRSLIDQFQGAGLPSGAPELYSILSGSFYQTKGTGQVNFTPDRSRDVAYSSLRLQQETGDAPIDDHRDILFAEEGLFFGCVLDLIVHNAPPEWWNRCFGEQAINAMNLLKAEVAANVDVIVGMTPTIKQAAVDELQALDTWSRLPLRSIRGIGAKKIGLNPGEVAEVEAEIQEMQMAQMQMASMGAAMNGQPGASAPAAQGGRSAPRA